LPTAECKKYHATAASTSCSINTKDAQIDKRDLRNRHVIQMSNPLPPNDMPASQRERLQMHLTAD